MKEELFFGCMTVLIIFNVGCYFINPLAGFNMLLGTVTGFMFSAIPLILLAGLQVGALTVDFSLSDVTVRFIAIFSVLVPLLISINLPLGLVGTLFGGANVPVGLGLLTNMYNTFITYDMWGLGIILTSLIGLLVIVSAMMIAISQGG